MSEYSRIDIDVHVRWDSENTLLPYLPKAWHERWLRGAGHTQRGLRIRPKHYNPDDPLDSATVNPQAVVEPGDLGQNWLDAHRLDTAIVSVFDAPILSTFGDIDYPTELARAVNRWLSDHWLGEGSRVAGTIVVASQDPAEAAKEIRRAAQDPRMVQVMLPNGAQFPYGHRRYYPIYEAAEECGLAVAIHGGTEGVGTSAIPSPCGWPGTLAEMRVARSTVFLAHLTSLVTEGVFVRFPGLRVVGLEVGLAWLPTYLWRFDKNYKGLRSECPWLEELPSEHIARHFRFSAQGAEPAESPSEFWRLLGTVGMQNLLMYGGNYPRWDAETPGESYVMRTASPKLLPRLWSGNALETYPRLSQILTRQSLPAALT